MVISAFDKFYIKKNSEIIFKQTTFNARSLFAYIIINIYFII